MSNRSVKSLRINGEVQREMSIILREELKDPRIHPMTSVTGAQVTNDLKYATIFVSVLGDEKDKKYTLEGLKRARRMRDTCWLHA